MILGAKERIVRVEVGNSSILVCDSFLGGSNQSSIHHHLYPTSRIPATSFGENMPAPPPPSPKHILRSHRDQITSLHISDDNERLYSGDITGLVVMTATRTLRTLVAWKAHANAILTVKEWEGIYPYVIS